MELHRDEDTRDLVLTHYGTSLFFNALEEEDLREWLSRPVPRRDGRRIENRVSALEDHLKRYDEVFNGLGDTIGSCPMGSQSITEDITDLQRQVQALTELMRVLNEEQIPQIIRNFDNHDQHFDVIYRKLGLGVAPDQRVSADEANAAINTPPQPAADDADLDPDGEPIKRCEYCDHPIRYGSRCDACGVKVAKAQREYCTAKVAELGLVPRVNPDDAAQIRVVADAMPYRGDASENSGDMYWAKRILTALAELNGRTNG